MSEIHAGDVGTYFYFTMLDQSGSAVPLGSAVTYLAYFSPPSGTVFSRGCTILNSDEGRLYYIGQAGDITEDGWWEVQAFVASLAPLGEWRSTTHRFKVYPNL